MVTVFGWWGLWEVEGLGYCFTSWAEILVLHGGSCWTETNCCPWSGMSGTHGRNGKCRMEYNYAQWYHIMMGNGSSYWMRGGASCCGGWKKSMRCAF